jgi:hypothetical protein
LSCDAIAAHGALSQARIDIMRALYHGAEAPGLRRKRAKAFEIVR